MEKASACKGLVKELRAFARQTGVAQVRDGSSRAKVEAMIQSIIASSAADVKTEATKVFEKYQSSFTAELESPVVQSANAEPFRLRGRSFLFTYNWDFFNKAFIDGAPKASDAEDLWKLWQTWLQERLRKLGITQYTCTLERSLQSVDADRVHFHVKLKLKAAMYRVPLRSSKGFNTFYNWRFGVHSC